VLDQVSLMVGECGLKILKENGFIEQMVDLKRSLSTLRFNKMNIGNEAYHSSSLGGGNKEEMLEEDCLSQDPEEEVLLVEKSHRRSVKSVSTTSSATNSHIIQPPSKVTDVSSPSKMYNSDGIAVTSLSELTAGEMLITMQELQIILDHQQKFGSPKQKAKQKHSSNNNHQDGESSSSSSLVPSIPQYQNKVGGLGSNSSSNQGLKWSFASVQRQFSRNFCKVTLLLQFMVEEMLRQSIFNFWTAFLSFLGPDYPLCDLTLKEREKIDPSLLPPLKSQEEEEEEEKNENERIEEKKKGESNNTTIIHSSCGKQISLQFVISTNMNRSSSIVYVPNVEGFNHQIDHLIMLLLSSLSSFPPLAHHYALKPYHSMINDLGFVGLVYDDEGTVLAIHGSAHYSPSHPRGGDERMKDIERMKDMAEHQLEQQNDNDDENDQKLEEEGDKNPVVPSAQGIQNNDGGELLLHNKSHHSHVGSLAEWVRRLSKNDFFYSICVNKAKTYFKKGYRHADEFIAQNHFLLDIKSEVEKLDISSILNDISRTPLFVTLISDPTSSFSNQDDILDGRDYISNLADQIAHCMKTLDTHLVTVLSLHSHQTNGVFGRDLERLKEDLMFIILSIKEEIVTHLPEKLFQRLCCINEMCSRSKEILCNAASKIEDFNIQVRLLKRIQDVRELVSYEASVIQEILHYLMIHANFKSEFTSTTIKSSKGLILSSAKKGAHEKNLNEISLFPYVKFDFDHMKIDRDQRKSFFDFITTSSTSSKEENKNSNETGKEEEEEEEEEEENSLISKLDDDDTELEEKEEEEKNKNKKEKVKEVDMIVESVLDFPPDDNKRKKKGRPKKWRRRGPNPFVLFEELYGETIKDLELVISTSKTSLGDSGVTFKNEVIQSTGDIKSNTKRLVGELKKVHSSYETFIKEQQKEQLFMDNQDEEKENEADDDDTIIIEEKKEDHQAQIKMTKSQLKNSKNERSLKNLEEIREIVSQTKELVSRAKIVVDVQYLFSQAFDPTDGWIVLPEESGSHVIKEASFTELIQLDHDSSLQLDIWSCVTDINSFEKLLMTT